MVAGDIGYHGGVHAGHRGASGERVGDPEATSPALGAWVGLAVPWLVAVAVTLAVIATRPWSPWADQLALLQCSPFVASYPSVHLGLTSCWLAGVAAAWAPDNLIAQNLAVRALAAVLYLVSAAVLTRSISRHWWLHAAVASLTVTTLHPFTWLSTELFVAAALCLALAACLEGWRPWHLGMMLGVLALTKPELVLVAVALGVAAARSEVDARRRWTLVAGFATVLVALVLPGVWQQGADYLARGNRSMQSLAQHAHILQVGRWDWLPWETAARMHFPGARNVMEVVLLHPSAYASHVWLSAGRLWPGLRNALGPAAYGLAVAAAWQVTHPTRQTRLLRLFAVSLIGIVPWLLLSLPHVRYFARYVPALLCLLALTAEQARTASSGAPRQLALFLFAGVFLASLSDGAASIAEALSAPAHTVFWGAD